MVWQEGNTAAAWVRSASQRNRMMATATERMFALAGVAEGMRVLDVGTGTGDTAILLGARVGPRGQVVATDASEAMIEAASQAVRAAGLSNVATRVEDAGASGLEDASFDAAVARCVLMFVDDLAAGLDEVRRLLRPGGRFAAFLMTFLLSIVASGPAPAGERRPNRPSAHADPLPNYRASFRQEVRRHDT